MSENITVTLDNDTIVKLEEMVGYKIENAEDVILAIKCIYENFM